eukprot:CAMPEP_0202979864 /NCGR_PEP_ID=MMETSP1396-20130829/85907_1 /ASSEMBLY_ACC=CAM_ASM_000872 /TAXON_ID= /ORGANISM="Pseudokeronopsis sp., Strain Brazil" /LENGTH=125 /DNA_ID=CAMNT_0049719497 /DNA_START=906 /DNA_END=1280 /DNA_ORIENTATION=-
MALGGHMTYHCSSAKKINIGKLDPCLAFTFLLKNYEDFKKFKSFMNIGKQLFQDNWLFSIFELKPSSPISKGKKKARDSNKTKRKWSPNFQAWGSSTSLKKNRQELKEMTKNKKKAQVSDFDEFE